jgi:aryl-alcohol dehydrogenase-like predicted oxidoreductase
MGKQDMEEQVQMGGSGISRRNFIKVASAAGAAIAANNIALGQPIGSSSDRVGGEQKTPTEAVPKRPLGKTGVQVSCLGIGGYHLGDLKDQQEANEVVARALDAGINFFDNAWEYHNGNSEERMGIALQGKRDQAFIMTKVCTHGRTKDVAMRQLEQSLTRLRTDHLDLWQIHEVVYFNDPKLIFARDGVIEALVQAKKEGKVRFVGFTGHKDPSIHLDMLSHNFPFDTVQMPLNCFDATFRSFEQQVLPEVNRRGMAALGMKSLSGNGQAVKAGVITPQEGLRYAMSLPVAVTISGIDSMSVLEQNLQVASGFKPMSPQQMQALRDRVRAQAADGRWELFKTTKTYDGGEGRRQHGFPSPQELPA